MMIKVYITSVALLLAIVAIRLELVSGADGKSPILIVPGFASSQLKAKVTSGICKTKIFFWQKYRYWNYWLKIRRPRCMKKVLSLNYDSKNKRYSNATGVEIRVPGFGKTSSVEYLGYIAWKKSFPKFNEMVKFFVKRGYVRGKTICAAPYDWRLAADEHKRAGYYDKVKQLVEEMYENGNNEKVTLVVHSMGGPMTLYFLNNIVSQKWKNKYIKAFVPLSGAWSGGNAAIPVVLTGLADAELVSKVTPLLHPFASLIPNIALTIFGKLTKLQKLNSAFQSMESPLWLFPNPEVSDIPLVITDEKTYKAKDYKKLFNDFGKPEFYARYKQVFKIFNGKFESPNVPTYCFYGVGIPTPERFHYKTSESTSVDFVEMGNGDGLVNRDSSEVCLRWSKQKAFFTSKEFNDNHLQIILDVKVFKEIAEIVGI